MADVQLRASTMPFISDVRSERVPCRLSVTYAQNECHAVYEWRTLRTSIMPFMSAVPLWASTSRLWRPAQFEHYAVCEWRPAQNEHLQPFVMADGFSLRIKNLNSFCFSLNPISSCQMLQRHKPMWHFLHSATALGKEIYLFPSMLVTRQFMTSQRLNTNLCDLQKAKGVM